jgi:long-subunit acyl-CoA synthetase (AMP-forming)
MANPFPDNPSPALAGYLPAFSINPNAMFISYFAIGNDKELVRSNLTRLEFWERARCAAGALKAAGLGKGDRFVLYMTDNRLEDMILRLASVMVGCAVS